MNNPYADIIHLSRPISTRHLPMSMHDRAAQFSPFSALAGYDAAILETARQTELRTELTESSQEVLDKKIQLIQNEVDSMPVVSVIYFEPDLRKTGGAYHKITGRVKKIDDYEKLIIFEDGPVIGFWQLHDIKADLLKDDMDKTTV